VLKFLKLYCLFAYQKCVCFCCTCRSRVWRKSSHEGVRLYCPSHFVKNWDGFSVLSQSVRRRVICIFLTWGNFFLSLAFVRSLLCGQQLKRFYVSLTNARLDDQADSSQCAPAKLQAIPTAVRDVPHMRQAMHVQSAHVAFELLGNVKWFRFCEVIFLRLSQCSSCLDASSTLFVLNNAVSFVQSIGWPSCSSVSGPSCLASIHKRCTIFFFKQPCFENLCPGCCLCI